MPWHIEENKPGCNGYAVVKDGTGEIVGCHDTQSKAKAQLTALNIAEYARDKARREQRNS